MTAAANGMAGTETHMALQRRIGQRVVFQAVQEGKGLLPGGAPHQPLRQRHRGGFLAGVGNALTEAHDSKRALAEQHFVEDIGRSGVRACAPGGWLDGAAVRARPPQAQADQTQQLGGRDSTASAAAERARRDGAGIATASAPEEPA